MNFIHTTDTHGWLGSHLTQENYNAQWGDLISFVDKMKSNVIGKNDLLVIDTGDKHDGNGISDATSPNGLNSTRIFNQLDFDLLTLGNHELYVEDNTILEYHETALNPKYDGKYISSNVEFVKDDGSLVPFGSKYRYFTTENHGYRVLSFSFLFNFARANKRAKVTSALEEIERPWFKDVLTRYTRKDVDIIVVFGHIPISNFENRELNVLHSKLRHYYPNTVIQYFGGHTHIRDFVSFDNKATALQSGRFCETVGFLSINDIFAESPEFSRRYIDFNLNSFMTHSKSSTIEEFTTELGETVNSDTIELRKALNLTTSFGYVPESYYMYNKPLTSPKNIYHLLINKVLPRLSSESVKNTKTRFIMINTGSIRYDLYQGPFTIDTEYTISPFSNSWNYIELPITLASQIESYLNGMGPIATLNVPIQKNLKCPIIKDKTLSKGYTTSDDYGCEGDDTPHRTEHQYRIPNVVQSMEWKGDQETVYFVYYSFIQSYILEALNVLNEEQKIVDHKYNDEDCKLYGGKPTKQLLREYIIQLNSSKSRNMF